MGNPPWNPLPDFVGFDRIALCNCFMQLYINCFATDMQLNKVSTHRDGCIIICSIFLKDNFQFYRDLAYIFIYFGTRWQLDLHSFIIFLIFLIIYNILFLRNICESWSNYSRFSMLSEHYFLFQILGYFLNALELHSQSQ